MTFCSAKNTSFYHSCIDKEAFLKMNLTERTAIILLKEIWLGKVNKKNLEKIYREQRLEVIQDSV